MAEANRIATIATLPTARPPSEAQWLTPAEISRRLAVSRSFVYAAIRKGELCAVYLGRLPRVSERDLSAYLSRSRRGGAA